MQGPAPIDEARDPHTTAARLAELAADHPETRIAIVTHPAVYPGLLAWLAEHGGEEVRAAVEGLSIADDETPPPVAAPVVSDVVGDDVAPSIVSSASRRFPKKVALIVGGAFLTVAVLFIAAVLIVPGLSGSDKIRVAEFSTVPQVNTWSTNGPFTASADEGGYLQIEGETVGQDLALVTWSYDSGEIDYGEGQSLSKLGLLNTRTGKELWNVDSFAHNELHAGNTRQGRVLVKASTHDWNETRWIVYDTSNGAVSAQAKADAFNFLVAPEALGGDFIATTSTSVSRYSIRTLEPVWSVPSSEQRVSLGADIVIVGSNVYSIKDGSQRSWSTNKDSEYFFFGGYLLTQSGSSDSQILTRIDESNGKVLWSKAAPQGRPVPIEGFGAIFVFDEEERVLSLMDLASGETRWTIHTDPMGGSMFGGSPESGVYILPFGGDRSSATAIDVATGELLYKVRASDDGDWHRSVLAMTEKTLYLSGGEYEELHAIDVRTGKNRWSIPSIHSNWYKFEIWGGNIIAIHKSGSFPGGDSQQYPRIIGVG